MKVYKFKCKDCGSKSYQKLDENTYKCVYCGCVEELISDKKETLNEAKNESENQENLNQNKAETKAEQKCCHKSKTADNVASERFTKALINFLICFFAGMFGVHKFLEGKIFLGIVYLFTGGLFLVGYIIDCIVLGAKLLSELLSLISKKAA